MKKPTSREIVAQNIDALGVLSHAELFTFARAHGLDSRAGFSAFKKALLEVGIDYDSMRAEKRADRQALLEKAAEHTITLFSDAKASKDRFAICNRDGKPVWYGKFFDSDRDYNGEQSSGEMAAAKKAVWLAAKVKEVLGVASIRLILKVDAEWLTWANRVAEGADGGGKARALGEAAQKLSVVLRVEHIPGAENPADAYTVCAGFQRWDSQNLADLAA